MFTGTGATKSLTSDPKDAEARLFRKTLPKALQVPLGKTLAAVRSIAVSPKVRAAHVGVVPGHAFPPVGLMRSVTGSRLLTAPMELEPFNVTWSPQHGNELLAKHWVVLPLVNQNCKLSVGLPPPLVKSNVTSRSPAVRLIVCGPGLPRPGVVAWLISKSMFAEPRLLVRSQARYRKLLPLANWDAS